MPSLVSDLIDAYGATGLLISRDGRIYAITSGIFQPIPETLALVASGRYSFKIGAPKPAVEETPPEPVA